MFYNAANRNISYQKVSAMALFWRVPSPEGQYGLNKRCCQRRLNKLTRLSYYWYLQTYFTLFCKNVTNGWISYKGWKHIKSLKR